jgi:hypothetical protein
MIFIHCRGGYPRRRFDRLRKKLLLTVVSEFTCFFALAIQLVTLAILVLRQTIIPVVLTFAIKRLVLLL